METSPPEYDIAVEIDEAITASIDVAAIRAAAEATLRRLNVERAGLTVALTTDEYVRSLNAQYRGIDEPTDVLSFATQESLPGAPPLALAAEALAEVQGYLGDLVIAYPYSARQAAHYQNSVTAELQLLVVHGVLHLLGYDHEDEISERAMQSLQEEILTQFGHAALARRVYE
ncbi:MAG: rRNA maturation RNase YbeY [Caldilinea sp.]|nr:rRNA maturation RNase YbeY [Caldilinea sp.]MDW8440176.1 rRNA maturation RNase YbeY [Caldilineaceae bacterium]